LKFIYQKYFPCHWYFRTRLPVFLRAALMMYYPFMATSKKTKFQKIGKAEYYERLLPLEIELNDVARWLQHTGKRIAVLFEGRDTAGKGGAIAAVTRTLNPRACRVVALSKPSELEKSQWYFQRYVPHLPAAGEIVLFDRSWYNRAGVERVMGYANKGEIKKFLLQTPVFEKLLVDDGVILLKYWLTVDQKQQEERFAERLADPLKRWKLSPIDLQAREKYVEYGVARDAMLKATHNSVSPWTLVDFNDQRRGRLTLIRHMLDQISERKVPDLILDFPTLSDDPKREKFSTKLKPIKPIL